MFDFKKIFGNKEIISKDGFYTIKGSSNKPVASQELIEFFEGRENSEGFLYTGYPLVGIEDGNQACDAVLISKKYGLVVFDIVEAEELGAYEARHDEIHRALVAFFNQHKSLVKKRSLAFDIKIVSFAPRASKNSPGGDSPYVKDPLGLEKVLKRFESYPFELYAEVNSALQSVSSIRDPRHRRKVASTESRGGILKRLEDSIANLENKQSRVVIDTFKGIHRIRGLAGSGKTIVLALKVAYLHAQNPDWDIAVTFNTRSLKNQFESLIRRFTIERIKQEPDWDKISILHAWGASGDSSRAGVYYNFCKEHGEECLDFSKAQIKYGYEEAFIGVCAEILTRNTGKIKPKYDAILIDEAQDFSSEDGAPFLSLCSELLREPKMLIYAYDELQSLTMKSMPDPEKIFPINEGEYKEDVLDKCYRNSRPMLATAHALGFGIHREQGIVQMFEDKDIWRDIGYSIKSGDLENGAEVVLERTEDSSPKFL